MAKPCFLKLTYGQWFLIDEMHQFLSPANLPELLLDGRSQLLTIITSSEIDHSRIQVKVCWFNFPLVWTYNVVQEIGALDLKSSRETGSPSEYFRMFPGQDDAANSTQGRAHDPRVRRFRPGAII